MLAAILFSHLSSHLVSRNINIEIYKIVILPVVLYGCETWSLTLREAHRLMVFEDRVLRRIFGLKKEEVVGGWRRLHNEELKNFHASSNIIRVIISRRMRWTGHVARIGEMRRAHYILVGKLEGRGYFEDLCLDGKMTLEWIRGK
jgi:hypothetical protein